MDHKEHQQTNIQREEEEEEKYIYKSEGKRRREEDEKNKFAQQRMPRLGYGSKPAYRISGFMI